MEVVVEQKRTPTENTLLNQSTKKSLSQKIKEKISSQNFRETSIRALIAYWILGLCNNYGYVVMLSAANDILEQQEQTEKVIL